MKNNEEIEQLKIAIENQKQQIEEFRNIVNGLDNVIKRLGEELGRRQVEIVCLNMELENRNTNITQ